MVLIHFMAGSRLDYGVDQLHGREKARLWC